MRARFSNRYGERHALLLVLVLVLGGCGGGGPAGNSAPPTPARSISDAEAARFLRQASFGPTAADIEAVKRQGYAGWIDAQFQQPAALELPYVQAAAAPAQTDRVDIWFQNAIRGKDQLRQRTAFALSEILVISDVGALSQYPQAIAHYYDLLADNAFGNFRVLLEKVTLNPAMGVFLSALNNQKADPARNIRPDENYAREMAEQWPADQSAARVAETIYTIVASPEYATLK